MANLSNVRLTDVGKAASGLETATLSGTVRFSALEISENQRYLVRGFLRERDDGRDVWNMLPNGVISRHEIGDEDEVVGTLGAMTVRPNGQTTRPFSIRGEFDFGNQESGNEEYYGVATVVPEIRGDLRRSNEVSINLG